MSIGLFFYNILSGIVFLVGFPFFILYNLSQGKNSHRLVERLGRYPQFLQSFDPLTNIKPVWIHAVSVGEVKAAFSLISVIQGMIPEVPILVSTSTPAGREIAESLLGKGSPVIYFPLDFYPVVKRALKSIQPRAFVALETELWPNFLFQASRSGCKLILANGRISNRTFKWYQYFRWLFGPILTKFILLLVRDLEDKEHFIALGAIPEKVQVLGNIKYDGLLDQAKEQLPKQMRNLLQIPEGKPVLVAGSTRGGEENELIEVYRQLKLSFPDLIFVLVPRHINRCPEIEGLLQKKGVGYQLFTGIANRIETRKESVVLVDRIGDLFALYSIATLVFCGASLVAKGGQNIMEPAAWGKMVFYGPSMEDFKDARLLLENAGAGNMVRNREDLEKQLLYFLEHEDEREKRGAAGREVLKSQVGLTKKVAAIVAEAITKNSRDF